MFVRRPAASFHLIFQRVFSSPPTPANAPTGLIPVTDCALAIPFLCISPYPVLLQIVLKPYDRVGIGGELLLFRWKAIETPESGPILTAEAAVMEFKKSMQVLFCSASVHATTTRTRFRFHPVCCFYTFSSAPPTLFMLRHAVDLFFITSVVLSSFRFCHPASVA